MEITRVQVVWTLFSIAAGVVLTMIFTKLTWMSGAVLLMIAGGWLIIIVQQLKVAKLLEEHGFQNVAPNIQARRIAGKLASKDKIVRIIPTRSMFFLVTAKTDDGLSVKVSRPRRDEHYIYVEGDWRMTPTWREVLSKAAQSDSTIPSEINDQVDEVIKGISVSIDARWPLHEVKIGIKIPCDNSSDGPPLIDAVIKINQIEARINVIAHEVIRKAEFEPVHERIFTPQPIS